MEYNWFEDLPDAKRLLKLPKFRKANIVKIELSEKDGKIKKTFIFAGAFTKINFLVNQ